MSRVVNRRREYLRQPVGRNPVREALDGVLRAMPFGAAGKAMAGAGAGAEFSPADIASLAHWYDATKISGNDGDAIGMWTDQEGTDDLTQSTSIEKPTLKTGVINSKQILRFDGSDDNLTGSFSATISQPDTIFVVAQAQTSGDDTNQDIYDGVESSNRQLTQSRNNADGDDWAYFGGSTVVESGTAEDTNPHIFTTLFNGASSLLRLDASQIASGDGGSDSLTGLTVAANSSQNSSFGDFDIGEILIYDADLANSNRDNVESYLSAKWGITI